MADKSTVISIVPFAINETKPCNPGSFKIAAAKADDFEFLVVGKSYHQVYLDAERGTVTIENDSEIIARSVVDDYKSCQLAYLSDFAEPGLFWIPGEYKDKKAILAVASQQLEAARVKQKNWFIRLVEIADDEWSKYHQHKSISDLQRYASKFLGLEREWNIQATAEANILCPACRHIVDKEALICGSCRTVIKPEEYKKRGFHTVGA